MRLRNGPGKSSGEASINVKDLAGDEGGSGRREEEGRADQIVGSTQAALRRIGQTPGLHRLVGPKLAGEVGNDESRSNGIDANADWPPFQGQRAGHVGD